MGNEESSSSGQSSEEEFGMANYQLIKQEYDRRFGEIGVYKHKANHQLVWIKETWIEDEATAQRIVKYINTPEYNSDCFITIKSRLIDKTKDQVCGRCRAGIKLYVLLEYFERDLEGEIMRRAEIQV